MLSIFRTRFVSPSEIRDEPRRFRLAFFVFFLIRWEVRAWKRLIFPEPVTRNRFFALECVFTFGMILKISYFIKRWAKIRKLAVLANIISPNFSSSVKRSLSSAYLPALADSLPSRNLPDLWGTEAIKALRVLWRQWFVPENAHKLLP